MTKIFGIALILIASGCATTKESFERGIASEDQFDRDSAACELIGEQNRSMNGMSGMAGMSAYTESYNAAYDACMRAKGYKRK